MSYSIFLLWTFIIFARPQDFFPFLVPLRPALLLTLVMLVSTVFNNKLDFANNLSKSSQVKMYLLLYLIMLIGIPFSVHRGQSFDFALNVHLSSVIYFYLLVVHVDSIDKLRKLLFTLCFSTGFYAVFCLINGSSYSDRFHFGSMYDPNDLAYFLVSMLPINFYFLVTKTSVVKKIIVTLTILFSIVITFMTGSRGGFLGLLAITLFLFLSKQSPLKLFQKVMLLIALIGIITFNADKIDTERYHTLLNAEEDYNVNNEEGRIAIWKKGLTLTSRNPITGVGVNCFHNAIGNYRGSIGELPKWQAAHNSYVQILTELGVIGFLVFLILNITAFRTFMRCARNKDPSPQIQSIRIMGKVVFLSFVGSVVSAFFLSMGYSMFFTLFFALSAVLQNPNLLADEEARETPIPRASVSGNS